MILICEGCSQFKTCSMKPDADCRCGFYLKGANVQIDENMSIDPTDDLAFAYDE